MKNPKKISNKKALTNYNFEAPRLGGKSFTDGRDSDTTSSVTISTTHIFGL